MMKVGKKLIIPRLCLRIAAAIIAIGLLPGCASYSIWGYGPDSQTREEFERRVEAAFRLQNRMTSEIMMIQSDGSDTQYHAPIIQAEQIMEIDCSHLNEYASREIDGLSKSLLLLRRVENSMVDCEASAKKVEELLKTHQR
jgi:hypothetical protein